jgi:hypothetical protein
MEALEGDNQIAHEKCDTSTKKAATLFSFCNGEVEEIMGNCF